MHKHPIDAEGLVRVTYYWHARYADIVGEHDEARPSDVIELEGIVRRIGFTETRRVINYYLMTAPTPSFEDFILEWPKYQGVAQFEKHDRMYRHPDIRQEYGNTEE